MHQRQSIGPDPPRRTDFPLEVSLFELLGALKRLVESMPEEKQIEIRRDQLSVAEKISHVLEYLRGREGEVPFEELFRDSTGIAEVVVTFLALLELMRLRMIRAWQAVPGGPIRLSDIRPDEGGEGEAPPAPGGETPAAAGEEGEAASSSREGRAPGGPENGKGEEPWRS